MGRADVGAPVGGAADDDRTVDLATAHVADVGGVVEDLVEGDRVERPEHELHNGADAEHRGAETHTDEAGLANGRIHDAGRAEFFEQALGDFISTIELCDFFAEHDDVGVTSEFLGEGVANGFAVGDE